MVSILMFPMIIFCTLLMMFAESYWLLFLARFVQVVK
jgi:hypothetical protein